MPLLAQLFATLFGGLLGGLAQGVGKKVANTALVVVALVTAGTVLMVLFNTTVAPLAASMFSTNFGQFLGLAFPPISGTCVAAFIAVWVGCNTYKLVQRTVVVNV